MDRSKRYHHVSGDNFEPGAYLSGGQFKELLKAGYLTPGGVWRKDGVVYTVVGNELYHNLLECVKNPDEAYLESIRESQRLRRAKMESD